MATTNVPPITFSSTGITVPQPSEVLTGRLQDLDDAVGGGLNLSLNTVQGQLASAETDSIVQANNNAAYLFNQFDPQFAEGRSQDALGRIYFLDRISAASTTVTCQCQGAPGTIIPSGSLAVDTSGNTYYAVNAITIGSTGSTNGSFANLVTGPIPCPSLTLTVIKSVIGGWERITNSASGELGNTVETQSAFEFRRQQSVALNAQGTYEAIRGAVLSVPGVTDCFVYDNYSGQNILYGATNYLIAHNSIFVAVSGTATSSAIASAIITKKSPGCNYNGNVTVSVPDPSGYSFPIPNYPVSYESPSDVNVYFTANIVNSPYLPANITTLIKNAIVAQFTGQTDMPRETIGGTVFVANYYGSILATNPAVELSSAYVSLSATPTSGNSQAIGIDQLPTISTGNITVNFV